VISYRTRHWLSGQGEAPVNPHGSTKATSRLLPASAGALSSLATRNSPMSTVPPSHDDPPDRQADAMKAQLREDVASWSKARSDPSQQIVAEPDVPAAAQPSPQPVARPKAKTRRAASAVKPASTGAQPFRMSYDGGTTAEYIQYMIDRGAR
jgi:hypothetical protein